MAPVRLARVNCIPISRMFAEEDDFRATGICWTAISTPVSLRNGEPNCGHWIIFVLIMNNASASHGPNISRCDNNDEPIIDSRLRGLRPRKVNDWVALVTLWPFEGICLSSTLSIPIARNFETYDTILEPAVKIVNKTIWQKCNVQLSLQNKNDTEWVKDACANAASLDD